MCGNCQASRLTDSVRDSLLDHVPALEQKIAQFAEKNKMLLQNLRAARSGPTASGSGTRRDEGRTVGRPVYNQTEHVINPWKQHVPEDMLNMEELESSSVKL